MEISMGLWLWLMGFEKGEFFSEERSETLEGSTNFVKRERERIVELYFLFPFFLNKEKYFSGISQIQMCFLLLLTISSVSTTKLICSNINSH